MAKREKKHTQPSEEKPSEVKPVQPEIQRPEVEDIIIPDETAEEMTGEMKRGYPAPKLKKGGFFIVGIGASAGGLEAFEQFFINMPADSGMAFVLIPHLSPEHKSMMNELLKRYTKMEIFQAEDGMQVKPDCLFIIPPDKDMSILNGKLHLINPAERRGLRHPIDFFFRSLAADQGERAICVILSGTGTEGTLGLKEIKGVGGLVIAQDPSTARYDGMPRSAVATGLVDYTLPADKIPGQLLGYIKGSLGKPALPKRKVEKLEPTDVLQKIFIAIRSHTGHDFSQYKHGTVMRRIERRMAVLQTGTLSEYYDFLRNHPSEVETLFRELLIRVTNFFRDPGSFEALKEKVLPALFENRPHGRPVRIWVAGCSTGEEAYSLAIIIREYMRSMKGSCKLQIFATDIDSGAVDIARAGVYSSNISVDVSPERLAAFFTRKDNSYKVKEEVRECIVFAVQNIIKDPPFSKLDMISCRNLLIYLSADLQKKVLPLLRYALNPGGVLFLGSSESIGDNNDLFTTVDKRWKIYKARKAEALAHLPLDLRPSAVRVPERRERPAEEKKAGEISIGELTANLLLAHYSPSCAVVDGNGEILYVHGSTGKYLEPAAGKATLNIAEMAREGLRPELRGALRQAFKQTKDISVDGLSVKTNCGFEMVNLEVRYLREPESLRGLMMVVFKDVPTPKVGKTGGAPPLSRERMNKRVVELEFELKSTREHLQTTVEELETSNEELQATNEELQSSNEELQSTNEELETSKEELQSINEELLTVNSELQHKMDELTQLNNDMNNLLESTQIATIYLDSLLRIRRYTPVATELIQLIQADIGRSMADIVLKMDYPDLLADAGAVLKSLELKEKAVRHQSGHWYLARISPYRTLQNVIDGVVITFTEVTEQRKEQRLEDMISFTREFVETAREPLLALDSGLRVLAANKAFYRFFRVSPEETEGELLYELGDRQWDIPALRKILEEVLPKETRLQDFEVEHDFSGIGHRKLLLNARRIEKNKTILLAIEDRT